MGVQQAMAQRRRQRLCVEQGLRHHEDSEDRIRYGVRMGGDVFYPLTGTREREGASRRVGGQAAAGRGFQLGVNEIHAIEVGNRPVKQAGLTAGPLGTWTK